MSSLTEYAAQQKNYDLRLGFISFSSFIVLLQGPPQGGPLLNQSRLSFVLDCLFLLSIFALGQIMLLQKCCNLIRIPQPVINLAVFRLSYCGELNYIAG